MYNLDKANKHLIITHARLARSMGFDPDNPPTEERVERWREDVMGLLSMFKSAHKEIERLKGAK